MKFKDIPNDDCIHFLMRGRKRIFDGKGLHLEHGTAPGRHWWRVDYSFNGKRRTASLGVYPDTSLDRARALAMHVRAVAASGIDPAAVHEDAIRHSALQALKQIEGCAEELAGHFFKQVAEQWVEARRGEWAAKYTDTVVGRIKNHLNPVIGQRQIQTIRRAEILQICRAIQDKGHLETGKRVFKICHRIFDYAIEEELLDSNPCSAIKEALKRPAKRHFPAITHPVRLAKLLCDIDRYQGTAYTRRALQLVALLIVRGVELRWAEWCEFDLELGEWRVPAIRMKGRLARKLDGPFHTVPLPRQAVEILKELYESRTQSRFVFPAMNNQDRCMSGNTMNKALRQMGYSTAKEMTTHGFRATARTMIVERLKWDKEIAELQLAHTVPDANGTAYNRAQLLESRREMLQAWADYLDDLRAGKMTHSTREDDFTPITERHRADKSTDLIDFEMPSISKSSLNNEAQRP